MKFVCQKCESEMDLREDKHVCPDCDFELSLDEATKLFEDGEIVGIVDESEIKEGLDEDTVVSNLDEDIAALVEGEDLSEAFVAKAKTIFEAAVSTRVDEQKAIIQEQAEDYAEYVKEETEKELIEKVDGYLDHVVSEWIEENKLAIESGIKSEMNESFADGIAELLKTHYIKAPEDRWDIVEGLADKVESLEAKLDEEIEINIEAKKKILEAKKTVKFAELSEGLTDTQIEKLEKLAENVDADSVEDYAEKVTTLKESYFKDSKSDEKLDEEVDDKPKDTYDLSEVVRMLSTDM